MEEEARRKQVLEDEAVAREKERKRKLKAASGAAKLSFMSNVRPFAHQSVGWP